MGKGIRHSISNMCRWQCGATVIQETAFVAGIGAAERVAVTMKRLFGDNKAVEYSAAFISAAAGSFAGHPANTAITRWQASLPVGPEQLTIRDVRKTMAILMLGAVRKTIAIGIFGLLYKSMKDCSNLE